ncbi:hypothetical protein [Snodgrassella communis]|uniref:hypothetical protein n=1 Tax=Snodgrassella communis TaxID=2946699 RepID=UPI001ED992B7|nr:hypothetical protein [Snodgrassella communis]
MQSNEKNINSSNNSDLELKLHFWLFFTSGFYKTSRYIATCFCIYYCVSSLSGKTTITSLSAIIATSAGKVSNVYNYVIIVLFILLIFAVLWAIIERQLRKRKVIEMSKRIVNLEKLIDKKRSSSYLNKDGSTRKEDKRDV